MPRMFSPAVEAVQARKGSRRAYARREEAGGWPTQIDDALRQFIEAQTSVFLGTASRDGQPYIQHRGGPPGFLRVLDESTIGFADFAGNRQYISAGNLSENPKAFLFLIDYAQRRRVKLWGEARVLEDEALAARLAPRGYAARPEHAILLRVFGWDENCPRHILQRFDAAP
jgi:predicted pyridoxine 5'-phosphate oxidase superfamily flavin-nucleotide-binding protein